MGVTKGATGARADTGTGQRKEPEQGGGKGSQRTPGTKSGKSRGVQKKPLHPRSFLPHFPTCAIDPATFQSKDVEFWLVQLPRHVNLQEFDDTNMRRVKGSTDVARLETSNGKQVELRVSDVVPPNMLAVAPGPEGAPAAVRRFDRKVVVSILDKPSEKPKSTAMED